MDKAVKLYRSLAQNPTLTSAFILTSSASDRQLINIQSKWTQRNLERVSTQKFTINHILTSELNVLTEDHPTDVTSELLSAVTEDGQYKAILRSVPPKPKDKDAKSKQFIEIWSKHRLLKNYDLSAFDVHGDVYTDGEFGSFEWSPSKTKLVYIAEKKPVKSEPFYKQKSLTKKNDNESKDKKEEVEIGNEYIYKPDWGEQLVGLSRPVVAVLDIDLDNITVLSGIPEDLSPGQVIWTPTGDGIVGTAWKHEPRQLGLIYCTNRESWIWIFHLETQQFTKLSGDDCCVCSPKFSLDGKHLVWLERNQINGPHHNAHRLMHLDFQNGNQTPTVLIGIVRQSLTIEGGDSFYGLYNKSIPKYGWSSDSKYLFFSTQQRANVKSYVFNIEERKLYEIENDSSSLIFLHAKNNVMLFMKQSLIQPPTLYIGRFDASNPSKVMLKNITPTDYILTTEGFDNLKYEMNEYAYDNEDEIKNFNYIYFGPKSGSEKSCPMIVIPHGGPHSAFSNLFSFQQSLLALLGFGILQINYRGSIGMGSDNVEYLPGKVGSADVKDCFNATQEALRKYSWLNPDKIGLYGGSHGGFLVAHLSGQYNLMYKVVVALNPAIDIAAMFTISDIPDWCATEVKEPFYWSSKEDQTETDEERLLKMFRSSPIAHVNKVIAPTLLCLGKNDLRVPYSQGKLWYNRLKTNQVPVKMLIYDDNHPLSTGPAEIDWIINATLWFMQHLQNNN